jgi:hypothetical protein
LTWQARVIRGQVRDRLVQPGTAGGQPIRLQKGWDRPVLIGALILVVNTIVVAQTCSKVRPICGPTAIIASCGYNNTPAWKSPSLRKQLK